MKRRLLTTVGLMLWTLVFAITTMAQTVTVKDNSAGGLWDALEAQGITDFTTVKNLTITGSMNDNDFLLIKNQMSNLESLDISGTNITQLPNRAFSNKEKLKTVRLPEGITYIRYEAFNCCEKLESVTFGSQTSVTGKIVFPANLRYVENNAFYNCYQLTHLDFSACTRLENLSSNAFSNLTNLKEVLFPSQGNIRLEWYCFNVDQQILDETTQQWIYKGLESMTLTKAITSLSGYCLPRTLKTLSVESSTPPSCEDNTFDNILEVNNSIKVYIPKGSNRSYALANGWSKLYQYMQEMGIQINISGYGSLQQGSRTYTNGDVLFSTQAGAITMKVVPDKDNNLISVKFNNAAVSVSADGTFTIPAGTTVGTLNVEFTSNMLTINNPNGGELKENIAALGSNPRTIRTIKIVGKMTAKDWSYVRSNMPLLEEFDISETDATNIPEQALQEHQKITIIYLPSTLTTIGRNAFNSCSQLTMVKGCENVKEIQDGAFTSCSKLSSFPFGDELQSLGECFGNCTSLPTKLVLPSSVYSIGWANTFNGSSIREFDLSQCHLTQSISQWIFGKATSVLLPEYGSYGVDLRTFEESNITEISFPACVTYIGENVVPSSVERVYARSATPIDASSKAFSNIDPATSVLYVPVGCKSLYEAATGWSTFTNIMEYGMQVIVSEQGKVRTGGQTLMGTTTFFPKEGSATFEIIPNAGWHVGAVMLDGVDIPFADNKFTLNSNQLDGKLEVTFAPDQFALELQIVGHGQVKLGSLVYTTNQTLTVDNLSTLNFTLEPAAGQAVSGITFNGKESVVQNGGTSYVTPAITGNSTLVITFGTGGAGGDVVTYTVNIGEGGAVEYKNTTLLSETTIQLPKDQDAVFTMKPDQYYVVNTVKLNGQDITRELDTDGNLTLKTVNADAKLEVSFRVNAEITVVMEDAGNLTNMLSAAQKENVTKLIIKGPMYDQDFFTMRDEMPQLAEIDLWEAQTGYIPYQAFCTATSWEGNSVGKKSLTNVRLPKTTYNIGGFAFAGCTNLKEVNFTELKNLEYLDSYAFENTNLQVIDLSNTKLTTVYGAFRNVKSLENIKFPSTLTYLGDVFRGCTLTEIDLSSCTNLKTLESTFSECKNLVKVTLPEGLTTINYAFSGCEKLTTINLPKSLQSIGSSAFSSTKLQKVDLSGLTELQSIGNSAFSSCSELKEVLFPASLVQLGNYAFYWCNKLTSVDLSKTQLQSVPEYAFSYCEVLESFKLPKTLETIGNYAFGCDYKLSGILELGPNFKSIGEFAFGETKISVIRSEATVPPVLNSNSMNDAWWEAAFVPEGYAKVYKAAPVWEDKTILDKEVHADVTVSFEGNLAIDIVEQTGLRPANITHLKVHGPLGQQDFAIIRDNMTVLYDLDISDAEVNVITEEALVNKKALMSVKLPASLLRIERDAFRGCSSLKGTLTLPDGLKFIGWSAFQGCSSLEEVVLNENLEVIQGYAFEGCSSLAQEITLPQNFQSLGESSFANCTSLYGTVKFNRDFYMFMGTEGYGSSASSSFQNCSKIEKVDMSEPDFLDEIPYSTFAGCTSLKTVLLPPTLDRIDNNAFTDCSSLNDIEFPNTLRVINWGAFQNCSSLTSINLSDCEDLGTIEGYAFNGCSSLENVYLPKSLNWIYDYAFADCRKLANLNVEAVKPADLGKYVFSHVHTDRCVLSIPTGTFNDYLSAPQWGAFVEMRKNIDVTVGEGANLYFLNNESADAARGDRRAPSTGQEGAKVKDGSSLYVQENETAIFKVKPDENVQIKKVLFNGKDVTAQMVNGTYETPNVTEASSFEVQVNVVGDIHVKELRMLDSDVAVKMGESHQLKFAIYPTNATNKSIEWTSSNNDVATVNADGMITGVAAGRAEITAKTVDGGFEEKCQIVIMSNKYWIVMEDKVDDFVENTVTLPLALHNESEARDIQFDIYLPKGVRMDEYDWRGNFGIQATGRAEGHTVAAARMSDGVVRVIVYSQDGNMFQNNEGELLYLPFITGEEMGSFDVAIKNIHISGPNNFDFVAPNRTIQFNLKNYPLGDSNGNGEITITDAVTTVDYILQQAGRFIQKAADVNQDDQITVADVTGTVDIVLERPVGSRVARAGADNAQGRLYMDDLTMVAGEQQTIGLKIENASDFIAFQCDINLPAGMAVAHNDNNKLMVNLSSGVTSNHVISSNILDNGVLRIVVMSPENENLNLVENNIVNLTVMADETMIEGSVIDIRDIRLVRSSDHSEYLAPDASATVSFEPTAIDKTLSVKGLKMRTEGHYLIVESSDATNLQMVSINGISRNLQIQAGENRFFIENAGVYIINGKKFFIK